MATDSSHRDILSTLAFPFFIESSLFLPVTMTAIKAWMGSKFSKIGPGIAELATLECLKKSPYTYNGRNAVSAFSVLDESLLFLQVTRTTIKAFE